MKLPVEADVCALPMVQGIQCSSPRIEVSEPTASPTAGTAGVLQKHIANKFGVCRCTIRLRCMKFGIAHHTTGQFRKGGNRNTVAIYEEMPFGVGVLFGDEFDCL